MVKTIKDIASQVPDALWTIGQVLLIVTPIGAAFHIGLPSLTMNEWTSLGLFSLGVLIAIIIIHKK